MASNWCWEEAIQRVQIVDKETENVFIANILCHLLLYHIMEYHDNGQNIVLQNNSLAASNLYNRVLSENITCDSQYWIREISVLWEVILSPLVTMMTICTNLFVICIFTSKVLRSPTTIILIGLAVSDSLSSLFANILHPYFYFTKNNDEYIFPYPLCWIYMLFQNLGVSFHTVSVYLTAFLGIQKFSIVAFPFQSRRYFTKTMSYWAVVIIYIVGFALTSTNFVVIEFFRAGDVEEPKCLEYYDHPDYCLFRPAAWLEHRDGHYHMFYYMTRCILIQIIPCLIITFSTIYLVRSLVSNKVSMATAEQHRRKRRLTIMITMIVGIFVVVELPVAIFFALDFHKFLTNQTIVPIEIDQMSVRILNFLLCLGYACNFWIYFTLSDQFRTQIRKSLRRLHITKATHTTRVIVTRSYWCMRQLTKFIYIRSLFNYTKNINE